MRRMLFTAVALTIVMTVLTGLAYPLVITGIAQGTLPPPGQRLARRLVRTDRSSVPS